MSRIGRKPISLPAQVTALISSNEVVFTGPLGSLTVSLHPHASVTMDTIDGANTLSVSVLSPEDEDKAIWGTMRALLAQAVLGCTIGYSKTLELKGVGFKMNLQGQKLTMALGFSHEVVYQLPADVSAKIENNLLILSSNSAQSVGAVASEIRALKKPEPYKGKGFRYIDEIVRRKAGKAAKGEK